MSVADPLLISKAFEVGTVHFGPRLLAFAAFQKMICGVSYDKIRLGFEQMLVSPWRAPHCCRAMQRLARVPSSTRDALVEALRASPVVFDETGWKQGGRRVWLVGLHEPARDRLRDTSGPWFRAGRLGAGEKLRRTLGVDGWAPYRCFKEATLQTCYNHLLHRCHELLETATRGAVRFPRLVKAILRHALASCGSARCWRDQRHGLRVAKGLLQAKMNRLLHGRFTNPANQRFAKHSATLSGQPLRVPRPCGSRPPTIPPNKTFASPWSTARPAEAATVPRKGHRPSRSS